MGSRKLKKLPLHLIASSLILLNSKTGFATNPNYIETVSDTELSTICNALETIGIQCGLDYKARDYRVYRDGNIIKLRGTYEDYDQFISAYMIAQSVAGVSRVSPAFDIFDTNIKIRKTEICLSKAMAGQKDPLCEAVSYKENYLNLKKNVDKIAILVSVGKFKDTNIPALGNATHNDAELVKKTLEKKGFTVIQIKDENATKENILSAIRDAVNKLNNGGTLFLYASSHGAPKAPNGETGIVLYDTYIESQSCKYLDQAISKSNSDKNIRDIIVVANKMCNMLKNSLIVSEDVFPILEKSNKDVEFIMSFDVCYSGGVLKNAIEKDVQNSQIKERLTKDSYSNSEDTVKYMKEIYPGKLVYISSASGNQTSIQTQKGDKEYGIFTYNFYTNLPKNNYDLQKNYITTKPIIQKESSEACNNIKKERGDANCDPNGQNPLLMYNYKVKELDLKIK